MRTCCLRDRKARDAVSHPDDVLAAVLPAVRPGGRLLLAACGTALPLPQGGLQPQFDDAVFAPPTTVIDPEAVFALSDEMARAVPHPVSAHRPEDPRQRLLALLQGRNGLLLEYDSARTRTAAEADQARAGDCLSLVIMTAAFAKAMGVPVRFQSVFVDIRWSRSGDR
jgi:transglutaminase-like putative cysteine protease